MEPRIQYARTSDGLNIAYQVLGGGSIDLVHVPGWISHLEMGWEDPPQARFYRRLASFSRLLLFDKRGVGLSDRVSGVATLEERMEDIRAVMDEAGSQRAVLFGNSEGATMAALFAATYPERTAAAILYGIAEGPADMKPEQVQSLISGIEQIWGQGITATNMAPSRCDDPHFREWWARFERASASPGAAALAMAMNMQLNIRPVLPTIRVPTLVLYRAGDGAILMSSRQIGALIPGARVIELPGVDHIPWIGDADSILDEVQEFVTGVRPAPEPDRVLATVLFTDFVSSTARAAAMGDRRWRDVLETYYSVARNQLGRFRGREVKTTGDGVLATFDGPARGIHCACAISDAGRSLGVDTRVGLHTGECELLGEDIAGLAVHIASRVAGLAAPNEVLVSSTVKDLVIGSGIEFDDRGAHALKGVPDEWRLFGVRRNT
jgi:class 3 adenylate cyclase/pimeloyl-ACP methyl ester carboxylesterase